MVATGNVGIGTSSPSSALDVIGEAEFGDGTRGVKLSYSAGNNSGVIDTANTGDTLEFRIANSERMRIDSSGNVLVGKTSISTATTGHMMLNSGLLASTRSGAEVAVLNRLTSDGDIAHFRKNGTTVGSIGTGLSSLAIGTGNTQLMFWNAQNGIFPSNGATVTDNSIDFGNPNYRFKDLYLSGGVYLGGTGAANKLDDYEEGTWNAHIKDTHDGSTLVAGTGQGKYTKIGNLLTININVYSNGVSATATGVPYFELPFTVSGANSEGTIMLPGYYNGCGIRKTAYITGGNQLRLGTTVENPYNNSTTGGSFSGSVRWYGTLTLRVGV